MSSSWMFCELQYLDGTTDVTRTVHFGKPSAHEKECFTQVLQGHIGLDTAVFPNGTTGMLMSPRVHQGYLIHV
ncbi:hypothetical protein O6H91_Y497900 [Diphasiastrum complanatum]|nr:hypothetical protein O6H91_Y497900 [Diphasiastrum complanatum]